MPRYFFHIDNGKLSPDQGGTELEDLAQARAEAVRFAGEFLAEVDGQFWEANAPWRLIVTDEDNRHLFTLHFQAEVPSGEIVFQSLGGAAD